MAKWQIVKHDDNGKTSVAGRARTPEKAREIADAERAQRLSGSSEWFEVREGNR